MSKSNLNLSVSMPVSDFDQWVAENSGSLIISCHCAELECPEKTSEVDQLQDFLCALIGEYDEKLQEELFINLDQMKDVAEKLFELGSLLERIQKESKEVQDAHYADRAAYGSNLIAQIAASPKPFMIESMDDLRMLEWEIPNIPNVMSYIGDISGWHAKLIEGFEKFNHITIASELHAEFLETADDFYYY